MTKDVIAKQSGKKYLHANCYVITCNIVFYLNLIINTFTLLYQCNNHVIVKICVPLNHINKHTHARTRALTHTHTHTHTHIHVYVTKRGLSLYTDQERTRVSAYFEETKITYKIFF